MRKIITEYYNLDSNKILKPIKLTIISDIHLSEATYKDVTKDTEEVLKKEKPDYILMPGDFFKGFPPRNCLLNKKNKDMLLHFLNMAKNYAPIIMSLGNHDLWYFRSIKEYIKFYIFKDKKDKFNEFDQKLREEFKKLKTKNIYPLDNDSILIDNIFFAGFYPRTEAYAIASIKNKKALKIIDNLNKVKDKITPQKDKYSILLHHQSDTLLNKKIQKEVKYIYDFDLCICGHEHNGNISIAREKRFIKAIDFVIRVLKVKDTSKLHNLKYWGYTESPRNLFFRGYCRGLHNINGTKVLISKGIPRSRHGGRNDDVIEIVNIAQKKK